MSIDVDLAMHALHRDSARLNQAYMEDDVDQAVKVTVRMMLLLAELLTERTQREVRLDLDHLIKPS